MIPFTVDPDGLTLWDWYRIIGKKFYFIWKIKDLSNIPGYSGEFLKIKRTKMATVKEALVHLINTIFPYTIDKNGVPKLVDYIVSEFIVKRWPEGFAVQIIKHLFIHPKNIKDIGVVSRMFEAEKELCNGSTFNDEMCYSAHLIFTLNVENIKEFEAKVLTITDRVPILDALIETFLVKPNKEKFDGLRLSYRVK
jgi:hypothetical protein